MDAKSAGNLGVYLKEIKTGDEVAYQAERPWYLSSTTKVPIAIALLREVEAGKISLSQKLVLQSSDYVDGAGELLSRKPGESFTVSFLLNRMLTLSDSSATDMLVRLVGEEKVNAFVAEQGGFGKLTTILGVRYGAFGELHPNAAKLTNLDYLSFKKGKTYDERLQLFAQGIGVNRTALRATSIEAAFERYYAKGENSASLKAFGLMLEKLKTGKLLNAKHTKLMLDTMAKTTTGSQRIKAALPAGAVFAQKTGTQVGRICNVGLVNSTLPDALVVAACVEKFSSFADAEKLLREVGEVVADWCKGKCGKSTLSAL